MLAFALATALNISAAEPTESAEMAMDIEAQTVTITVSGRQVHVTGAEGQTLEIYNLTGTCVASIAIDSEDKTLNVNLPKGCYILKVGKVARKVSIR